MSSKVNPGAGPAYPQTPRPEPLFSNSESVVPGNHKLIKHTIRNLNPLSSPLMLFHYYVVNLLLIYHDRLQYYSS